MRHSGASAEKEATDFFGDFTAGMFPLFLWENVPRKIFGKIILWQQEFPDTFLHIFRGKRDCAPRVEYMFRFLEMMQICDVKP